MKINNLSQGCAVSISQSRVLSKIFLSVFVLTSIFILPFLVHNQIFTGSMVNAALLVSVSLFGLPTALSFAVVPSLVALFRGLLPVAFAPIVPFVILSNILFIIVFRLLSRKKLMGGLIASCVKFIFLFGVGQLLLAHVILPNIFQKASLMMGWFQLITALLGTGIALSILKIYQLKK